MTKKLVIAGILVVAALWVAKKTHFMSYAATCIAHGKESVRKHIPRDLELASIRNDIKQLDREYTDLFGPILEKVEELAGQRSRTAEERAEDWRKRVIADHSRAVAFMIMDGIYPSNQERGYVLRRLLRRASTFGRLIGIRDPFMHEVVPKVVEQMGDVYPELIRKQELILKTVRMEEQQFNSTLEHGMRLLEAAFAAAPGGVVPGEQAFRLYDTYGFPLELTREMDEERGLHVDEAGGLPDQYQSRGDRQAGCAHRGAAGGPAGGGGTRCL